MKRYLVTFCVILTILLGLAIWRLDYLTKQNTKITLEKKACLEEKENYKNAQVSSSKLIKELRSEKAKLNTNIDCYNVALPEYVIRVFDKLK